jgi:hypothetical protein
MQKGKLNVKNRKKYDFYLGLSLPEALNSDSTSGLKGLTSEECIYISKTSKPEAYKLVNNRKKDS